MAAPRAACFHPFPECAARWVDGGRAVPAPGWCRDKENPKDWFIAKDVQLLPPEVGGGAGRRAVPGCWSCAWNAWEPCLALSAFCAVPHLLRTLAAPCDALSPPPPRPRPQSELGGSAFEGVKESVGNFFSNTLGGLMGGKKEEEKAA